MKFYGSEQQASHISLFKSSCYLPLVCPSDGCVSAERQLETFHLHSIPLSLS